MNPRTKARLAAGTAALGGLLCTAIPAHAALTTPQANAFVVSAEALGGFAAVPPTPTSTYAPGGTTTAVDLHVGPFASNATATATTTGDPATGDSSATATVDQLGVTIPGATIALTGIRSTCTATPTGATGNGVIATGSVSLLHIPVPITLAADAAPNTTVTVPRIATIVLNQQVTNPPTGVLTVDALHITLLTGAGANIIIGQAQCGGAPPANTNPTPMISAPVAAGAGATAMVGGVVMLRRRKSGKNVFDAS